MACLLAIMRCWVYEKGCSAEAAWYLCLYDTAARLGSRADGYSEGYRDLRCSVDICREAITNLEYTDTAAYLYVALYASVLFVGGGAILCARCSIERQQRRRVVALRLAPPS
eukprot:TRINITY_DN10462_c0_g1_i1.p2 TRINITY_DN10462_c0_g1~~TRINITY_DN10462_c0_g1_i1.p2  ORF type:complete len:112 (+),score=13.56 TRINITY_DN10462_c0_g1_i1:649-984(+)